MKAFNLKAAIARLIEAGIVESSLDLARKEAQISTWHTAATDVSNCPDAQLDEYVSGVIVKATEMFGTVRSGKGQTLRKCADRAVSAKRKGVALFVEGRLVGSSKVDTALKALGSKSDTTPSKPADAKKPGMVIDERVIADVLKMLCDPDIARQYVVGILTAAQASGMIEARMLPNTEQQAANLKERARSKAKFAKEQAAADKATAKAAAKRDKEIARLLAKPLADISSVPALQVLADQNAAPVALAA